MFGTNKVMNLQNIHDKKFSLFYSFFQDIDPVHYDP